MIGVVEALIMDSFPSSAAFKGGAGRIRRDGVEPCFERTFVPKTLERPVGAHERFLSDIFRLAEIFNDSRYVVYDPDLIEPHQRFKCIGTSCLRFFDKRSVRIQLAAEGSSVHLIYVRHDDDGSISAHGLDDNVGPADVSRA